MQLRMFPKLSHRSVDKSMTYQSNTPLVLMSG